MQLRIPRRSVAVCPFSQSTSSSCKRYAHGLTPAKPVPQPTPFVPDVATFLKLIGRELPQHASKFPTWESFFLNKSFTLRTSGIEPARARRYLLWWRERYRRGDFGLGGDLTEIVDGTAELRVIERDGKQIVVNSRPGDSATDLENRKTAIAGIRILQPGVLSGPYLQPAKGSNGTIATLKIQEGLWEVKRGQKVKGGERKRKVQDRADKKKREQEERDRALGKI